MAKNDVASNVDFASSDSDWSTLVKPYGASWNFEENPVFVGTYLSTRTVELEDLNELGKMRATPVHAFVDANGEEFSIWSSYNIDMAIENVSPGTMMRIRFEGKVPVDGGKRTVKQFTIQSKK